MRGRCIIVGEGLWIDNETHRACVFPHGGKYRHETGRWVGFCYDKGLVPVSYVTSFLPLELL